MPLRSVPRPTRYFLPPLGPRELLSPTLSGAGRPIYAGGIASVTESRRASVDRPDASGDQGWGS